MDGALERAVVDKKQVPEIDFFSSHNRRWHSGQHAREGLQRYVPKTGYATTFCRAMLITE
jgi:hypothetical protein